MIALNQISACYIALVFTFIQTLLKDDHILVIMWELMYGHHPCPTPPFHCLQYRFINEKLGIKAIWKHQEVNFGMDIKVACYVLCHNLERECTNVVTNAAKQLCYVW